MNPQPEEGISIHALLAESDESIETLRTVSVISIHALLAESDRCKFGRNNGKVISIHALLAESDTRTQSASLSLKYFYPRSPCGERRCGCCARCRYWGYFYPRSPCGERPYDGLIASANFCISIHALLAESDNQE